MKHDFCKDFVRMGRYNISLSLYFLQKKGASSDPIHKMFLKRIILLVRSAEKIEEASFL